MEKPKRKSTRPQVRSDKLDDLRWRKAELQLNRNRINEKISTINWKIAAEVERLEYELQNNGANPNTKKVP